MVLQNQDKLGSYAVHENRDHEDVRETEKRALISCANRLKAVLHDEGKDKKAYADAISHNQKLWTLFQVALCDPENPLPRHLKSILLNLSNYIDRISFRAVGEYSPALITNLIDLNLTIAVGLNKKPTDQTGANTTIIRAKSSSTLTPKFTTRIDYDICLIRQWYSVRVFF